jgi:hypothetical protein
LIANFEFLKDLAAFDIQFRADYHTIVITAYTSTKRRKKQGEGQAWRGIKNQLPKKALY